MSIVTVYSSLLGQLLPLKHGRTVVHAPVGAKTRDSNSQMLSLGLKFKHLLLNQL